MEVHSIFYTLQGEGPYSGYPAVFVRLAGCNLQCTFCDTEYTAQRTIMTPEEIFNQVKILFDKHPPNSISAKSPKLIVLTGGEPFRQDLIPFFKYRRGSDYFIQVETNGTIYSSEINKIMDSSPFNFSIVVSPKAPKVHPELEKSGGLIAYKYVLEADAIDPIDGLPTTHLGVMRPARPQAHLQSSLLHTTHVYITPMDSGNPEANKANLLAVRDSALKFGYIANVQLHKYLDLP